MNEPKQININNLNVQELDQLLVSLSIQLTQLELDKHNVLFNISQVNDVLNKKRQEVQQAKLNDQINETHSVNDTHSTV